MVSRVDEEPCGNSIDMHDRCKMMHDITEWFLAKKMSIERVLCAAIHYKSSEVFEAQPVNIESGFVLTGWRHSNILPVATRLGRSTLGPDHCQGFLTTENRFVDREEGMRIAIQAGQVVEGRTYNKRQLFSEDLY